MTGIAGKRFICSWSGGKDSCLSLHRALRLGGRPGMLLTMMREDGERSRSHGLPSSVLEAQASSLGIPLITQNTSWNDYEKVFVAALRQFNLAGMEAGVFGDIDLQEHLDWILKTCDQAGIEPVHPLWGEGRRALVEEFIDSGFKAKIVVVKDGVLDRSFLGRDIDRDTLSDLEKAGVDASGEGGEYHTVVTDGPVFRRPLRLSSGTSRKNDGCWFLDVNTGARA